MEEIKTISKVSTDDEIGVKCWCCGSVDFDWSVMYAVWCRSCGATISDLD